MTTMTTKQWDFASAEFHFLGIVAYAMFSNKSVHS